MAGQYFLGSVPQKDRPIALNGAIFMFCRILKIVVASAAEVELGALFLNYKEGKVLRLTLEEMGHRQPPTPVHCDNLTATGIANDTVKKQRSRSICDSFGWPIKFHQAFQWNAPSRGKTLVPAREEFFQVPTKSSSTQHSESVCWNSS